MKDPYNKYLKDTFEEIKRKEQLKKYFDKLGNLDEEDEQYLSPDFDGDDDQ